MPDLRVVPFPDHRSLRDLLDEAFDGEFSDDDWRNSLGGQHVLLVDGERLLAHAAVVPRPLEVDGRVLRCGYVEAVAAAVRGRGDGTRVMSAAGELVRASYELGALSTGAWAFYERLGWERWQGPTGVRRGGAVVRTPEDDDGVMVLRSGATADLALTGLLVCDDRPGDVW